MSERNPEPLPPLVRSRVAVARRGLLSVRLFQSTCLGVSAALFALSAGLHASNGELTSGICIVAGVNGLLVAFWWACIHRRSAQQVARDVDKGLSLDGALFTAWEAEGATFPTEIARRLGQQVAGMASPRQMLRAILPASLPMLAIPFAAIALLLAVLQDSRRDPIQADLAGLVEEMRAGIGAVAADGAAADAESDEDLTSRERQELQQAMRAAGKLGEELKDGNATEEDVQEMADRLAELEESLAQSGSEPLMDALDRTQAALDSARMSLEGGAAGGSELPESAETDGAGATSAGSGLASKSQDGRMGGLNSHPPRAKTPGQPGVLGSPSWPRAYDGIVRRWIESTR